VPHSQFDKNIYIPRILCPPPEINYGNGAPPH
jgi:hypothetical protein